MTRHLIIGKSILILMFAFEVSADEAKPDPEQENHSTEETDQEKNHSVEQTEQNIPCIRCDKRNHVDVHLLGVFNPPIGVSGVSFTRHLLDRTSVQGGIGYGFGGVNLSAAVLHYLERDNSLHILTGLSLTTGIGEISQECTERKDIKNRKDDYRRNSRRYDNDRYDSNRYCENDSEWDGNSLEGLWINLGFGGDFSTQSGISYGLDFGLSMGVFSDVFSSEIKICFGVIASESCEQPWRILPYMTFLKIGYSW